jgi:hypothetical protein
MLAPFGSLDTRVSGSGFLQNGTAEYGNLDAVAILVIIPINLIPLNYFS